MCVYVYSYAGIQWESLIIIFYDVMIWSVSGFINIIFRY